MALETNLDDARHAAIQAKKALNSGDKATARACYSQVAAMCPEDKTLVIEAADGLAALSCVDEAVAVLQSAIERLGGSPLLRKKLSNILTAAERYAEAFDVLSPLVASQPSAEGLFSLGKIAESASRIDDAEQAYRAALDFAPDYATTDRLSWMLAAKGQLDEAEKLLRAEINRIPDFGPAHISLSLLLLQRERFTEALTAADAAIAASPDSAAAHCVRGRSLLALGQIAPASDAFQRALVADPDNAEARWGAFATKASIRASAAQAMVTSGWVKGVPVRASFADISPGQNLSFGKDLSTEVLSEALEVLKSLRPEQDAFASAAHLRYRANAEIDVLASAFNVPNVIDVDLGEPGLGIQAFDRVTAAIDLVTAIDIFDWLEDATLLIQKIGARLSRGGVLVYSADACDEEVSTDRQSDGRFRHGPAKIEQIGAQHGLQLRAARPSVARIAYGRAVPGYIGIMTRL